jgi:hypothetical protein
VRRWNLSSLYLCMWPFYFFFGSYWWRQTRHSQIFVYPSTKKFLVARCWHVQANVSWTSDRLDQAHRGHVLTETKTEEPSHPRLFLTSPSRNAPPDTSTTTMVVPLSSHCNRTRTFWLRPIWRCFVPTLMKSLSSKMIGTSSYKHDSILIIYNNQYYITKY